MSAISVIADIYTVVGAHVLRSLAGNYTRAGSKELNMVIQCKNLISLYILPDQRRGNLLVLNKTLSELNANLTCKTCSSKSQMEIYKFNALLVTSFRHLLRLNAMVLKC